MKEFIEKLIGRFLGECVIYAENYEKALNIANELTEEYINISTTNADRIRSMTDEELAEFFDKLETVCDMCACNIGCCNIASENCKAGFLKWLQSEVEGVTENE